MTRSLLSTLALCGLLVLATRAIGDDHGRTGHITMSHKTAAHAELACTDCHAAAESSSRADDSLIPNESTCARCHAAQVRPAKPAAPTCGKCHAPLGAGGVPIARAPAMPRELHFSHRAHLLRGTQCGQCHADVNGEPQLPRMERCLDCHRAQQASSCKRCHTTDPAGRLRTEHAGGRLLPRGPLMGMAHDADWIVRHRWVGADRGAVCSTCHEERQCVRCHDGRLPAAQIHAGDYLALHAQDARRGSTRCRSCHAPQTFCGECHSRMGLTTFAPREVRASGRFHPPAAQWSRGPAMHAREARRDLTSCTSCHAEADCVACHGGLGVGRMSIDPHPPGFRRRCDKEIAANSRACVTCHGSVAAVRRLCD